MTYDPAREQAAVRGAAEAYCRALHEADAEALAALCQDRFFMTGLDGAGVPLIFDKTSFVERVRARAPFEGAPSYEVLSLDVAGPETAQVKLWVDLPPRRFEDYLGFVHIEGRWRLITKLFRTAAGPAL